MPITPVIWKEKNILAWTELNTELPGLIMLAQSLHMVWHIFILLF